jgi:hypothetical protein
MTVIRSNLRRGQKLDTRAVSAERRDADSEDWDPLTKEQALVAAYGPNAPYKRKVAPKPVPEPEPEEAYAHRIARLAREAGDSASYFNDAICNRPSYRRDQS